ncbi:MAG TPA: glycosyltransferase family 1 protein [Anditalea sp.]|nr:glycosyltransferase family 1 protein [Anditalea sp.]
MKKPLRIGIEAQRLFRPKKHGMDIVALELIRHLQEEDLENEYFIFVKPDEDNGVIKETPNFKIIEIEGGPYPIWEQVHLPKALKIHKIQLLHCTSNTAPLRPGVPLVITLHDIIYLEKMDLKKGTWYQRIGNLYRRWNVPKVVPNCETILTVSEFEHKRIVDHFKLKNQDVQVVYNSVGDHFLAEADAVDLAKIKVKYELPDKFMFFLANTDPKKNLRGVLQALTLLHGEGKLLLPLVMLDFKEEYLMEMLKEIGASDLRDMIHISGYVPNRELPFFYKLADIYLYPSLRESFGIPILESMACGTPVITSNTSSMPEVSGGAAILIDPFNPQSIAEAILQLDTDTDLREDLIQKGLNRAQRFSWANTAKQVRGIYEEALKHTEH